MKYRRDFDAVMLMYSTLKRLGSGEVSTFAERLRSQKTQYLAQVFGISPTYDFNLYIRGPYSPSLANDLFNLKTESVVAKIENFTPSELEERFQNAFTFISGKSIRQLELISTLHWLENVAGMSRSLAVEKLKVIKEPSAQELVETQEFVKSL